MITVKRISKKGVNPAMHGIAAKKKVKTPPIMFPWQIK